MNYAKFKEKKQAKKKKKVCSGKIRVHLAGFFYNNIAKQNK